MLWFYAGLATLLLIWLLMLALMTSDLIQLIKDSGLIKDKPHRKKKKLQRKKVISLEDWKKVR